MSDARTAVREALAGDLAWLERLGVVDPVSDADLAAIVETYDEEYAIPTQLDRAGESYVVSRLVFDVLRRQDVALFHDTECIYGYESYAELLAEYAELTDGLLDELIWEIDGDWSVDEPASITAELRGECVEATLRYGGDWMDLDGFLSLLNRMVATATDDPRRFAYLRADTGTTAHVVFAHPDEIDALETYFERAVEDYKRHREE